MSDEIIASAARAYVMARREHRHAKAARRRAFADHRCTGPRSRTGWGGYPEPLPECFRSEAPISEWCRGCADTQLPHDRYRKAADQQGAALRHLTAVVMRDWNGGDR